MELVSLSAECCRSSLRANLGLSDVASSQFDDELVAASFRRVASLLCPTSPRSLIRAAREPLALLYAEEANQEVFSGALEAMLGYGDLMEFDEFSPDATNDGSVHRLIYAAPSSFITITEQRVFLLGVAPDDIGILPNELQHAVVFDRYIRFLPTNVVPELCKLLIDNGLNEVSREAWLRAPQLETSAECVRDFDRRLDAAGKCGEIRDLTILDGSRNPTQYRNRWVEPKVLTGRFIGRRSRAYGADLWCYIELNDGRPLRLIDLPVGHTVERGCDQAWRLQCALDSERGTPQRYRLTPLEGKHVAIDLFSPISAWLQRRWECTGTRPLGHKFRYVFDQTEISEETDLLSNRLWMIPDRHQPS